MNIFQRESTNTEKLNIFIKNEYKVIGYKEVVECEEELIIQI